jgi:hypothetical protein
MRHDDYRDSKDRLVQITAMKRIYPLQRIPKIWQGVHRFFYSNARIIYLRSIDCTGSGSRDNKPIVAIMKLSAFIVSLRLLLHQDSQPN